jgi:hypothetical protein
MAHSESREQEDSVGLPPPPPRRNQRRFPLLAWFVEYELKFRFKQRWELSGASLALGRARAHSLIQGIVGAFRSSIELVLGYMPRFPPATGAVCLGDTSDIDGSEGALNNPESHTFGLPVVDSLVALGCAYT